jgi:hypothetical protein
MVYAVLGLYIISCVGVGVRRKGLALSVGHNLKTETKSSLRIVVF